MNMSLVCVERNDGGRHTVSASSDIFGLRLLI